MVLVPRGISSRTKLAALLTLFLIIAGFSAPLSAQDGGASASCSAPAAPANAPSAESADSPAAAPPAQQQVQPGQTAAGAASEAAAADPGQACPATAATLQLLRYISPSDLFSSSSLASSGIGEDQGVPSPNDTRAANLYAIAHPTNGKYPVTLRTGRWGGEEWLPATLETLGFTLFQHGYRLIDEQKTRQALLKETWHSYWVSISGLHTWSDGGKTWTVYIAHPAQGAVFNFLWTEHDPHSALVPFGFNKVYWGGRLKAFWWDSLWEVQWKLGPFSEASIGNVGLKPGKLGANTIVASAVIGTGEAAGEDMLDRYAIAKWELHTTNRTEIALMRSILNPDRSLANLFRGRYPWYRDRRPRLLDREPPLP